VAGVIGAVAALVSETPITFVAVTLNVYAEPLVSPVTSQVRAPEVEHVRDASPIAETV